MNLNETLFLIAAQIKCDAKELIDYSNEDQLGGYHWNSALATFKQGSCFGVEGQTLYALIRWLKPDVVAELGGWAGCSGSHIAAALIKNGKGKLYSVDNEVGGQPHGVDMSEIYRQVTTLVRANAQDWLAEQPDESIDFIFEDADHSIELVAELTRLALRKLKPGTLLVNHDASHDEYFDGEGRHYVDPERTGYKVRTGLELGGAYFRNYLAEPSDCGLAITVMPGERKNAFEPTTKMSEWNEIMKNSPRGQHHLEQVHQPGNANIESMSEPPTETPTVTKKPATKRKPKTKAK